MRNRPGPEWKALKEEMFDLKQSVIWEGKYIFPKSAQGLRGAGKVCDPSSELCIVLNSFDLSMIFRFPDSFDGLAKLSDSLCSILGTGLVCDLVLKGDRRQ